MTSVNSNTVGVVIGRFQVNELHEGHLNLLNYAKNHNDHLVVFLGVKPAPADQSDPLDFQIRKGMLSQVFPDALILPLVDQPTDEGWSKTLDGLLWSLFGNRQITLYSGTDGFVPRYKGQYQTKQLDFGVEKRGTEIREAIKAAHGGSESFRAGIIYALGNLPPRTFMTVDILCYQQVQYNVFKLLLVRKNQDATGKWRLPGGFLSNSDESLETAARRELYEETGLIIEQTPQYLGSFAIQDWRSKNSLDVRHMTGLFIAPYTSGMPKAGDDVNDVYWLPYSRTMKDFELEDLLAHRIVPEHNILLRAIHQYFNRIIEV